MFRSPEGFIYDKEAILEYIIHKKAENAKKLAEYTKTKNREKRELAELAAAEERSKTEKFVKLEKTFTSRQTQLTNEPQSSVSNMSADKSKQLPSFWIPSETPHSTKHVEAKKPDTGVYCPMSGKPLKAKDLYEVMFTPIDRLASGSSSNSNAVSSDVRKVLKTLTVFNLGPLYVPSYT